MSSNQPDKSSKESLLQGGGDTFSLAQVGMIGLAVMGANLARNLEGRGYRCAVFNRTWSVTDQFLAARGGDKKGGGFIGAETLKEFVASLERPRKIFIMIQAGPATDQVIDQLIPLLEEGDIIIDGGNSYFRDTVNREAKCREKGLNFLGIGISGGEEGALKGPSLMPGGDPKAWAQLSEMLSAISAKVDGQPCTAYIGPDGAGHFVKMIHNGIEYGDMQLIAESYDILQRLGGFNAGELSDVFNEWNKGVLESFLIEITSKVLSKRDSEDGGYLVDKILDVAGQKGTGRWTVQAANELGVPAPTLAAAVDSRSLSARKVDRIKGAGLYARESACPMETERKGLVSMVHDALYAGKILSYAQGMEILAAASREYSWKLNLGEIASLWRGGCIIRARFLNDIKLAFDQEPELGNLIFSRRFSEELKRRVDALRSICALACSNGIAIPAFSAAINYFDLITTVRLPVNLTQAQRDFFGAHTYKRIDREGSFHTEW